MINEQCHFVPMINMSEEGNDTMFQQPSLLFFLSLAFNSYYSSVPERFSQATSTKQEIHFDFQILRIRCIDL